MKLQNSSELDSIAVEVIRNKLEGIAVRLDVEPTA